MVVARTGSPGLPVGPLAEAAVDAAQRSILLLDLLRQRGNQYLEHAAEDAPHVLGFPFEVIRSGRRLARPVNYALVRILPPADRPTDPAKRPFVVVDPRAGHGPGIGGMKPDSEIGAAIGDGHPCYFIGFLPHPEPGQTIEAVCAAIAEFLAIVRDRHPAYPGRPCVIGNCQAGWMVMMTAALRPDLIGPMLLAGSPLSYWAGVEGANPMRYQGGVMGGTWVGHLLSDLGNGIFDGAHLVANFESLNPSNTYWSKLYNVWAKVDTEGPRFLSFERWWGGHILLNGEEMAFITDQLFVGNNLTAGAIRTEDGLVVDLRAIRSPIIVFCSQGDNITPPQQALGWILDLYADDAELLAHQQTIVYSVHGSIGHLGIFVSGSVAKKEHEELTENMDLINVLPPGLYEVALIPKTAAHDADGLVQGDWVARFERRGLADLRELCALDDANDRRFLTAARVSEANVRLYKLLARPLVRAMATDASAEARRRLNPARVAYEAFADTNPLMGPVAAMAERVRADRRPAAPANPFVVAAELWSQQIVAALDLWRDLRDLATETTFKTVYGNPVLQALMGVDEAALAARRPAGRVGDRALVAQRVVQLRERIGAGGALEAVLRGLCYVLIARGSYDERGFAMLRRIKAERPETAAMTHHDFKRILHEQHMMLVIDEDAALAALRGMLPEDAGVRAQLLADLRRIVSAVGEPTGEVAARLDRLATLFHTAADPSSAAPAPVAEPAAEVVPAVARPRPVDTAA
jgi:hypothetical protein